MKKFTLFLFALLFLISPLFSQTYTGTVSLVDRLGVGVLNYVQGDTLRVSITDADRNISSTTADTVSVDLSSEKEITAEKLVLTETGVNTGIFEGRVFFDEISAVSSDGVLQVNRGNELTATYIDPADDFGNTSTIIANSFYGMTAVTSGSLSANTTWTKANSPYLLTGDVVVPNAIKLTIDPGVVVRFKAVTDDLSAGADQNRIEIRVEGELSAKGTAQDSIHFVSNAQNPSAGDWHGIVTYGSYSGKVSLKHCRLNNYVQGIRVEGSGPSASTTGMANTDTISVSNTKFYSGGDALFTLNTRYYHPVVFENNVVSGAGINDNIMSSYKSYVNNTFTGSSYKEIQIYSQGVNSSSTNYLKRTSRIIFKNNTVKNGVLRIRNRGYYAGTNTDVSDNAFTYGSTYTNVWNDPFEIKAYNYYNNHIDSSKVNISGNNFSSQVEYYASGEVNCYSNPSRVSMTSNNFNRVSVVLNSDQLSRILAENNTIDSTYYSGLSINRFSGLIKGNTITTASKYDGFGIELNSDFNYTSSDTLLNNTITNCGYWSYNSSSNQTNRAAIEVNGYTRVVANYNNFIDNNNRWEIINNVPKSVISSQDFKYNYWGDSTTAEINTGANPKNISTIYDEYDDNSIGFVNYGQNFQGPITKDILPDSVFYAGDSILLMTSNGTPGNWSNGVNNASQVELNSYSGKIKITFDFSGNTAQDSTYVVNLDTLYISGALREDSLAGPIPGGNGASGNMFNIINTSGRPLNITGFSQGPGNGGSSVSNVTVQVYSTPGDYLTQASSTWSQEGTALTNLTSGASTGYCPVSVTIPVGATYGFYVGITSGSVQYTNGTGTAGVTTWFSNNDMTVTEGLGGGYPNPTNNPRCWNGTVYYGGGSNVTSTVSIPSNARPEAVFTTIQAAIDASDANDVILIESGEHASFTLQDNVNYSRVGLTVMGLDSLNRPTITGYDSTRSIEVLGTDLTLKHLSLRNGYAGTNTQWNSQRGGLLYGTGTNVSIVSCDFKDGYAPQGGDYYAGGGGLTFINCEFLKNEKQKNTMIHVDNGMWAEFYNSLFNAKGYTNRIFSNGYTHRIYNSTFVNLEGRLYVQPWTGHEFVFVNNILTVKAGSNYQIEPDTTTNLWNGWDGMVTIKNSRLPVIPASYMYNTTGGISVTSSDTLPVHFVDSANGDFRLSLLDDHHNIGDTTVTLYKDANEVNRPDVNGYVDYGAYESDASFCEIKNARASILQTIRDNAGINNVTLSFPGTYTSILWSTGDTSQSIYAYPNIATSYWVTAIDNDGCTLTDTIAMQIATITFRVDMRNQPIDSTKGVHLPGSWNGWLPNIEPMSDANGDLIYERTVDLVVGDTVQYKFLNGNTWTDPVDMVPSPCGVGPNGNRTYNVIASDTLTAVHLSSCTEASPVDPLIDVQAEKCENTTIDLFAGSNVTNVVWNTGDTTNTISVKDPGLYWFTAIYPSGVVVLDSTVVPANFANPDTTVTHNSLSFCSYNSATLTASAGNSYLWSNGDTTQSITLSQSGSYYAIVTTGNGCVDTTAAFTTTVYADPDTSVSATSALSFCNGDSTILIASAGNTYLWNTGETTQSIASTQNGVYQALVTSQDGCVDTTATYTVTVFADPDTSVTVIGSLDFCAGGSVTLTAASGQSYLWSTGDTTQTITSNMTGTHSATVTTSNGCSAITSTYATTAYAAIDNAVSLSGPLSFCSSDSVTLTASGGPLNNYTYLWSSGETTQSITPTAGIYSAIITSADGCFDTTATYTVTVFADPDTSVTTSGSLDFCAGNSVTLTAASGQSYLWSNGATTQSITSTMAGTYSAVITSADGCIGATSTYVTSMFADADTSVTLNGPLSFCDGSSITFSAVAGQSYLWNTGETTQSITRSQSTSVFVIVTSPNGCVDTSSTYTTSVYLGADTTVTASGPLAFCDGGSVTFTAASGYNYIWNTGDTAQSITTSYSGLYSATITTADGCVGNTMPMFVNVYAGADTSVSVSQTLFCASDSAVLVADVNQNYLWNTGDTTQYIVVNTTGDYFVNITTLDGCIGVSDSINITVVPDVIVPQIVSNGLGWVASGSNTSLTIISDSNYTYQWGVSQGAFIMNGQGTDSINVFWGPADSNIVVWLLISNGVCIDSTGIVLTISGIGIGDDGLKSVSLYPNPNDGHFVIKVGEENIGARYKILDGLGRPISEGAIKFDEQSFDLADKPKGLYRIQIINKNGTKTLSVVVQ